jgi:hypothetical protein
MTVTLEQANTRSGAGMERAPVTNYLLELPEHGVRIAGPG